MSERIFSNSDVERILRNAISNKHGSSSGITESELFKIASELGISRDKVSKAINEDHDHIAYLEARKMWISKRHGEFYQHLTAYFIVNTMLVGLDWFLNGPGLEWAYWPVFGWGIGLAIDFVDSFFPNEEKIDKGAKKMMKSKKWKDLFENLGFSFLEGLQKK
ncbi:hypothetical protein MASR1M45_07670 [Candidatus Kapaibacterium sp.]